MDQASSLLAVYCSSQVVCTGADRSGIGPMTICWPTLRNNVTDGLAREVYVTGHSTKVWEQTVP